MSHERQSLFNNFFFRFSYSFKVRWIIFLCSGIALFIALSLINIQTLFLSIIERQRAVVTQSAEWNAFLKEAVFYSWEKNRLISSPENVPLLEGKKSELMAQFMKVSELDPGLIWKKNERMIFLMSSYQEALGEILKALGPDSQEERAFVNLYGEMQKLFNQGYTLLPQVDQLSYLLSKLYLETIPEIQLHLLHLFDLPEESSDYESTFEELRGKIEFWGRILGLMKEGGVLHPGAITIEDYLHHFSSQLKAFISSKRPISKESIGSLLIDSWNISRNLQNELKDIFGRQIHMFQSRNWMGGGASILGILVVFTVYLTRVMRKPLKDIREAAISLANGNLNAYVAVVTQDEVAQISRAFNEMATFCKGVMVELDQALNALSQPSKEMITYAQACERNVLGQQDSVSRIAKHSKKIWARGIELQNTLEQMRNTALETEELAKNGRKNLTEMENILNAIAFAAEQLVQALTLLQKKTQAISEIITVILSIADQATLLSINTAIRTEKHRLHLSGFGVIAKKIAELAHRVGSSALRVEEELRQVMVSLTATLEAVQDFSHDLQKLVFQARASRETLRAQIEEGQQQIALFEQVSLSMHEQIEESSRVHETIWHLSEVAQTTAESISAFSVKIAQLYEDTMALRELTERFQRDEPKVAVNEPVPEPEPENYSAG